MCVRQTRGLPEAGRGARGACSIELLGYNLYILLYLQRGFLPPWEYEPDLLDGALTALLLLSHNDLWPVWANRVTGGRWRLATLTLSSHSIDLT